MSLTEIIVENDIYPVIVTQARYSGVYEGGYWVAFNNHPESVPAEAFGSDITAADFWYSEASAMVGRGSTPDSAYEDLKKRIKGH